MSDNKPLRRITRPSSNLVSVATELGNKPKKSGNHPIYIRITENRKLRRLYLGYDIPKVDWNANKRRVKKSNPLFRQINDAIEKKHAEVTTIKSEVKNANAAVIVQNLKGVNSEYFFPYAYQHIDRQAYNTARNIRSEVNKLREFVKNDHLQFSDLTVATVNKYQHWLKTEKNNGLTTIHKGLSKIRTIVNQAVREGFLPIADNPFLYHTLKEGTPHRVRLTEQELQTFMEVALPEGSLLWHTRNYWLFAYYGAGIRFSDVACLQWKNVAEGRLTYLMRKTKHKTLQNHSVKLSGKAFEILAAYRTESSKPEDYIFPILSQKREYHTEEDLLKEISRKNALVNKYLKKICFLAGLPKDVSFHSARHTFADLGRRKIGDVYKISKLLRHSKISITEKYLSDFDTEMEDSAMDELFGE